jgi:hypothetical protein
MQGVDGGLTVDVQSPSEPVGAGWGAHPTASTGPERTSQVPRARPPSPSPVCATSWIVLELQSHLPR